MSIMSINIGVSGEKGSFSEEAAVYYCQKNKISHYELNYLISVDNVLDNLIKGKIQKGIFPVENSNGGIVYEAVYAMAKYIFEIEKMFEIDVKHNLMALQGVDITQIKKIASHPQALKQCRMYLKRKKTGLEIIEWDDTAKAAEDLKNGKLSPDTAVIAPIRCAEIYGLDVIEESIQDLKFNFTTFLAVKSSK